MKKHDKDKRIKTSLFPFSIFVMTSIGFALFTTGQMRIIGEYIDISKIPLADSIAIPAMWVLAAAAWYILKYCALFPVLGITLWLTGFPKGNKVTIT